MVEHKLKPCPFCGGEAVYSPPDPSSGDYVDEIGCRVLPKSVQLSKDEAVKTWNTRPIEDAQAARIKDLEAALSLIIHRLKQDRESLFQSVTIAGDPATAEAEDLLSVQEYDRILAKANAALEGK